MRAPDAQCERRATVPGAWAMEQVGRRTRGEARHGSLALRDRIDPSPVRREQRRIGRGAIGWRGGMRRRGSRSGQARHRRRAIPLDVQRADQRVLRSAHHARRHGRGALGRSGHRHGHPDGARTGRGRGVLGLPAADDPDTHRRYGFPRRARRPTAASRPPRSRRPLATPRMAACAIALPRGRAAAQAAPAALVAADGRITFATINAHNMSFARRRHGYARTSRARLPRDSDDYGGFRRRMGDGASAQRMSGGVQFARLPWIPRRESCASSAWSPCRIAVDR